MTTPEDRRRDADGQDTEDDDNMRQDVHIERLYIPASTKVSFGVLFTVLAGLVGWNLIETISNGKQQRDDKREVWIAIGKQEARIDVVDVRLNAAESRLNKMEDRK